MRKNKNEMFHIFCYLGGVVLLSGFMEWWLSNHRSSESTIIAFLMVVPGFCGLLCCVFFGYSLKDLGLRLFKFKYFILAYSVPATIAVLQLLLLLLFKIDTFSIDSKIIDSYGGLRPFLISVLVISPTYYVAISSLFALGEEIGWRGFLYSRLTNLGVKNRDIWIGLLWSLWHWPLIFIFGYSASPYLFLDVMFFTIGVTALSVFMGWLRDKSNSIAPCAISHGVHNMWIQGITPLFVIPGTLNPYFAGEFGLFIAALYFILALAIRMLLCCHRDPKLIYFIPELLPSSRRMNQCSQA